jgi:hypothetical protein
VIRVAVAIGVVGLLWTAVPKVDAWQRTKFADRMAQHAEASSGGEARLAVRRLASSGASSLAALVRLAGSANPEAADAAREAVMNQLAAWEVDFRVNGDVRSFGRNVAALGGALERAAPAFGAEALAWADRVAFQLADTSDQLAAEQSFALLAHCDRILSLPRPVTAGTIASAESAPKSTSATQSSPTVTTPQVSAEPPSPPTCPSASPELTIEQPADAPSADLKLVDEPPAIRAPATGVAREHDNRWQRVEPASPPPHEAPEAVAIGTRPLPASPEPVIDVPSPLEARLLLRRYRKLSNRELIARLNDASGYELLAMEQVLRERKIPTASRPTQASAGLQADADRRLFERVGQLPAAEARRLLRDMVADPTETTEIRLEALSLLATSGDPQLAEIARQRVMEDADPRVADLATQILRETR